MLRKGNGFLLDPRLNLYEDATGDPWVLDRYLPHRVLQQAQRNAASLRHLGSDGGMERVSYAAGGQITTLGIDARTRLLAGHEQVASFGIFGDGVREMAFSDYRSDAGFAVPATITARNRSATTGQWSYNVLAVEFADHLLVGEAPLGSALTEDLLGKLRQLAPGKPVRYLVQSHHHSDHLGGIRGYVAEGATLILGPSAAALVERIAAAHPTLNPDRLARSPRAPVIERLPARGSRVFKDAGQEVVVFDSTAAPWAPRT